jgi:hypothetical protein
MKEKVACSSRKQDLTGCHKAEVVEQVRATRCHRYLEFLIWANSIWKPSMSICMHSHFF